MKNLATPTISKRILAIDSLWAIEPGRAEGLLEQFESGMPGESVLGAVIDDEKRGQGGYGLTGSTAVIRVSGPMLKVLSCEDWMMGGLSTVDVRRQVRAAMKDPAVETILLVIDSPGGQVAGTHELAQDVAEAAKVKRVVAHIEDFGCSAAYWVASQATEVTCNATAMVGSIGVYGVVYDAKAYYDKVGVTVHLVSSGGLKGQGVEGTQVSEEYLEACQANVDAFFEQFKAAVSAGRPGLDVDAVATGAVWIGQAAVDAGLVDRVAVLDDVLSGVTGGMSPHAESQRMSEKTKLEQAGAAFLSALGLGQSGKQAEEPNIGDEAAAALAAQQAEIQAREAQANAALKHAAEQLASAHVETTAASLIQSGHLVTSQKDAFQAALRAALGEPSMNSEGKLVVSDAASKLVAFVEGGQPHELYKEKIDNQEPDGKAAPSSYEQAAKARFKTEEK